ncbi:hypothetical protein Bca101_046989 [Brassica carinata]
MKGQPASQQSNKNMTDRPTKHRGPEVLRDGLGTIRPSGHRATAHSPSGHCHITPSCNHSAIGHDPVYLSLPDPANKGFP